MRATVYKYLLFIQSYIQDNLDPGANRAYENEKRITIGGSITSCWDSSNFHMFLCRPISRIGLGDVPS